MRSLAAVAALIMLAGCSGNSPESPTGPEPQATPAPAATPTPAAVEPTPEIGPSYWSAWYDEHGVLHHENMGGHVQQVTSCAYWRGEPFAEIPELFAQRSEFVRPHSSALIQLPERMAILHYICYRPTTVLLLGITGTGRACTADSAQIGNITARLTISWPCNH